MSNKTDKDEFPQPPIPKRCFLIALGSIYFFHRSYGRIYERDYDAGILYISVGVLMLAAAYAFYRGSRI